MRKAVVRQSDGFVVNVIVIESGSDWPLPEGYVLVDAETSGSPGDTWDDINRVYVKSESVVVKPHWWSP